MFFLQQARGENCMATVGGSLIAAHFLTRGKNKSFKKKGECFGINRANKLVRGRQSFRKFPQRRSAARLSVRLCPTAKLCPCHTQITRQHQSSSLRRQNLRQANNGWAVVSCYDNNSSTRWPLLRAHPQRGHLNGGYTTPLNYRSSKRQHHPRAFSLE